MQGEGRGIPSNGDNIIVAASSIVAAPSRCESWTLPETRAVVLSQCASVLRSWSHSEAQTDYRTSRTSCGYYHCTYYMQLIAGAERILGHSIAHATG
jgi:hypothetical protein